MRGRRSSRWRRPGCRCTRWRASAGCRLITADRVAAEGIDPQARAAGRRDWTPDAQKLVAARRPAGGLISFDPPVIAWWLYYHLQQVSALFPHTFMFEGAREPGGADHALPPAVLPSALSAAATDRPAVAEPSLHGGHDQRQQGHAARARPGALARSSRARCRSSASGRACATGRSRASATRPACALSKRSLHCDDFDLYGEGWEQRHPAVEPELHEAAERAFRGPVHEQAWRCWPGTASRWSTRTRAFPATSRKSILECFFARCIPIYSGAPDVAQYVPPSAFIDVAPVPDVSRARAVPGADDRGGRAPLRRRRARVSDLAPLRELVRRALRARCGGRVTAGRHRVSRHRGTTVAS